MRRTLFIVLLVGLLVSSCSDKSEESVSDVKIVSDCKVLSEYVEVVDNQLVLTVSESDAAEMGISSESYRYMKSEIDKGNAFIGTKVGESENPDRVKVIYQKDSDIKDIVDNRIDTKFDDNGGDKVMPQGRLSAPSNIAVTTQLYAPGSMSTLQCSCYSWVALFPAHFVTTIVLGKEMLYSRMGPGDIIASLAGTDTYFTLKFQTTDYNGGFCNYQGT